MRSPISAARGLREAAPGRRCGRPAAASRTAKKHFQKLSDASSRNSEIRGESSGNASTTRSRTLRSRLMFRRRAGDPGGLGVLVELVEAMVACSGDPAAAGPSALVPARRTAFAAALSSTAAPPARWRGARGRSARGATPADILLAFASASARAHVDADVAAAPANAPVATPARNGPGVAQSPPLDALPTNALVSWGRRSAGPLRRPNPARRLAPTPVTSNPSCSVGAGGR
jgi:hypothetical protein